MARSQTRILILGAGFSGVAVARRLAARLPGETHQITIVDQHNFLLFTPLLTEVVGGEIDPRDSVAAVRTISGSVRFQQGRVESIDIRQRKVTIAVGAGDTGLPEARRTLQADLLVIALGSTTNFHGLPGVQEHSLTVKSIGQAESIRNRVLAALERAAAEPDPSVQRRLLTFVVAGGGFSGVETMAALNDFVRSALPRYGGVARDAVRTVLVQPGDRLLPELDAGLAGYAEQELRARGVEVVLKTPITAAGEDHVELGNGERIDAYTLVWAAGVTPAPVVKSSGAALGKHGGIVVDGTCAVPGHPGVWALGDCAEVPRSGGGSYAPTAQNATREGRLVANNIVAARNDGPARTFTYRPVGELALVGRRAGVASVYGVHISGFLAWAMWRAVYLAKMPSTLERVRVGLNWLLDLRFQRDLAAISSGRTAPAAPDAETPGR